MKWACGGPGAAYVYVRPDLLPKLRPMSTGWFAHAEPFAFDMGPMRYAADAWRIIGGTMPIPAVFTARAGWESSARLGVETIRDKSLRQTTLLREPRRGARLHGQHAARGRGPRGDDLLRLPGRRGVSQAS